MTVTGDFPSVKYTHSWLDASTQAWTCHESELRHVNSLHIDSIVVIGRKSRSWIKSVTSWQQVVVMEFGKRHDTTDTTDNSLLCLLCRVVSQIPKFGPRQLVTDLLRESYGETGVMDFGFKPARGASSKNSYSVWTALKTDPHAAWEW